MTHTLCKAVGRMTCEPEHMIRAIFSVLGSREGIAGTETIQKAFLEAMDRRPDPQQILELLGTNKGRLRLRLITKKSPKPLLEEILVGEKVPESAAPERLYFIKLEETWNRHFVEKAYKVEQDLRQANLEDEQGEYLLDSLSVLTSRLQKLWNSRPPQKQAVELIFYQLVLQAAEPLLEKLDKKRKAWQGLKDAGKGMESKVGVETWNESEKSLTCAILSLKEECELIRIVEARLLGLVKNVDQVLSDIMANLDPELDLAGVKTRCKRISQGLEKFPPPGTDPERVLEELFCGTQKQFRLQLIVRAFLTAGPSLEQPAEEVHAEPEQESMPAPQASRPAPRRERKEPPGLEPGVCAEPVEAQEPSPRSHTGRAPDPPEKPAGRPVLSASSPGEAPDAPVEEMEASPRGYARDVPVPDGPGSDNSRRGILVFALLVALTGLGLFVVYRVMT